nr:BGlu2 [Centaurium erythraea subsp. erythraea]
MAILKRSGRIVPSGASMISRGDFPADFVFGSATAAYQVEGGAREGGRGPSIWDTFTHRRPDMIKGGGNGDVAVDSYHLYKEDIQLLKNIGLDAYRLSISWSRVLPGGNLTGGVNKEGIDYYNSLIDDLLANGIQPFVTLFHWDAPQALEDEYGGFLSPRIVDDFRQYVELCFWEFGDRVKHWITLNEPSTFSDAGYASGVYAPGRGSTSPDLLQHRLRSAPSRTSPWGPHCKSSHGNPGTEPYIVTHHLLLAHATAVELYRNKFQKSQGGSIGITLICQWREPLNDTEADRKAAKRALDFMFGWYMEPITSGDYPESMKELVGSRLPKFSPEESKKLRGSYDFLGLNYYTGTYVTDAPKSTGEMLSYDTDAHVTYTYERNGKLIGPKAASDWLHMYPEGMYKLLIYTKNTYNVPLIYITENGVDEVNNTSLTLSEARQDTIRIKFIQDHLYNLLRAMKEGVNVKGYFIWSLLDNFEWNEGYTVRFGIVHVDYNDNNARYPKDSAIWLFSSFNKNMSTNVSFIKNGCVFISTIFKYVGTMLLSKCISATEFSN